MNTSSLRSCIIRTPGVNAWGGLLEVAAIFPGDWNSHTSDFILMWPGQRAETTNVSADPAQQTQALPVVCVISFLTRFLPLTLFTSCRLTPAAVMQGREKILDDGTDTEGNAFRRFLLCLSSTKVLFSSFFVPVSDVKRHDYLPPARIPAHLVFSLILIRRF